MYGLLKWEGKLVGGSWFAWKNGWKIGLWWHMIKQMGKGNYEVDMGHLVPHEEGGLLRAHTPLFKNYLLLQGNLKSTKPTTQD